MNFEKNFKDIHQKLSLNTGVMGNLNFFLWALLSFPSFLYKPKFLLHLSGGVFCYKEKGVVNGAKCYLVR